MFRVGETVYVLNVYEGVAHGEGIYLGHSTSDEHRGKIRVKIEGMVVNFEPSRVVNEREYIRILREEDKSWYGV